MIENSLNNMRKIREKRSVSSAGIYWFITAAYMVLIYSLSSKSDISLPVITNFDKLMHMCAYILLSFLFYISLRESGINKYIFITAFILTVIYGISDEVHQSFVPGRDSSIGDVIADSTGAFVGALIASYVTVKTRII